MESILLSPWLETPEALSEDARQELVAILKLCARLNAIGANYSLFTIEFCDKHIYDLAAATMHVAKLTLCETP